MSLNVMVYEKTNKVFRCIGKSLKFLLVVIGYILLGIVILPANALNWTFGDSPESFKDFLHPFDYGGLDGAIKECNKDPIQYLLLFIAIVMGVLAIALFPISIIIGMYVRGNEERKKMEEIKNINRNERWEYLPEKSTKEDEFEFKGWPHWYYLKDKLIWKDLKFSTQRYGDVVGHNGVKYKVLDVQCRWRRIGEDDCLSHYHVDIREL